MGVKKPIEVDGHSVSGHAFLWLGGSLRTKQNIFGFSKASSLDFVTFLYLSSLISTLMFIFSFLLLL